jgi:hypothetical protein
VAYQGLGFLVQLANLSIPLVLSGIIFSFALSLYLFIVSFKEGSLLALGGNSGNIIYDVSERTCFSCITKFTSVHLP